MICRESEAKAWEVSGTALTESDSKGQRPRRKSGRMLLKQTNQLGVSLEGPRLALLKLKEPENAVSFLSSTSGAIRMRKVTR